MELFFQVFHAPSNKPYCVRISTTILAAESQCCICYYLLRAFNGGSQRESFSKKSSPFWANQLSSYQLFRVEVYGYVQNWLGWIKLAAICVMLLYCFVDSMGGNERHDRIGFRYWMPSEKSGAFRGLENYGLVGKTATFLGLWSCMVQACFAYTGAEVVGVSFGEVKEPRKAIPTAIKLTAVRIISIYILGVLVVSMSVSPLSPLLLGAIQSGKKSGGKQSLVL
jgi:amino acid permease